MPTRSLLILAVIVVHCFVFFGCAFSKNAEGERQDAITQQQLDANRPLDRSEIQHQFINDEKSGASSVRVTWPTARPFLVKFLQNNKLLKAFDARTESSFVLPCANGMVFYSMQIGSPRAGALNEFNFGFSCQTGQPIEKRTDATNVTCDMASRLSPDHAKAEDHLYLEIHANWTVHTVESDDKSAQNISRIGTDTYRLYRNKSGQRVVVGESVRSVNIQETLETVILPDGLIREVSKKIYLSKNVDGGLPSIKDGESRAVIERVFRREEERDTELSRSLNGRSDDLYVYTTLVSVNGVKTVSQRLKQKEGNSNGAFLFISMVCRHAPIH